jgi:hypothetical protein
VIFSSLFLVVVVALPAFADPARSSGFAISSQNRAGSKLGQQMTQPPDSRGAKTCRTMPPTWKSGIRLQFTSRCVRFHDRAMVAAAVSMSPSRCGTNFLFPVVPDVNKTSTSSAAALGAAGGGILIVVTAVASKAAAGTAAMLSNAADVATARDAVRRKIPASRGLGTRNATGMFSARAIAGTVDDDASADEDGGARHTTRSAPHRSRSARSSDGAECSDRGTHEAQWHAATMANARPGPLGSTSATRYRRSRFFVTSVLPSAAAAASAAARQRRGWNSSSMNWRTRACEMGWTPAASTDAMAAAAPPSAGMADAKVGKRGAIAAATSRPKIDPFGCRWGRAARRIGDAHSSAPSPSSERRRGAAGGGGGWGCPSDLSSSASTPSSSRLRCWGGMVVAAAAVVVVRRVSRFL